MKIAYLSALCLLSLSLHGCHSDPNFASGQVSTKQVSTKQASLSSASKSDTKVFKIGESGVQVSVPLTWKAEVEGSTLSLSSPDQGVFVAFVPAPNAVEADQSVEQLKTTHKKSKNYKDNGAAVSSQVGALKSSHQSGTFEDDGDGVSWATDTVKGKALVVIYSLIQDSFKDKNASESQALMGSIKATS